MTARTWLLLAAASLSGCSDTTTPVTITPAPSASVVASFSPGQMLESIALSPDGRVHVTQRRDDNQCDVVQLEENGDRRVLTTLPALGGLAFNAQGVLYVTSGGSGSPGQVWRIAPTGERTKEADLPTGAWPNGITLDASGARFVTDSALGTVWRLTDGSSAEAWVTDEALRPADPPTLPGANGLKFFAGALYVSNSSKAQVLRVSVREDGTAGEVTPVVSNVAIDDFAFDAQGVLYATTHLFNTVLRLVPGGSPEVLLDAAQGANGPSAAAFGVSGAERMTLYVTTDGNFFGGTYAQNGQPVVTPVVLRLSVSAAGAPLF